MTKTLQKLLELIGPVTWAEDYLVLRGLTHTEPVDGRRGWYIWHGGSRSAISEGEAHNHICMAAIEWLNKDGRSAKIYGPNCNHIDGERATCDDEWCVTVFMPFVMVYGSTLLDALLAAVEAVKKEDK